ncbi:MAG: helix-turn-helix transcriptional regulator [Longimicrobiales bacterium]
MSHPFSRRLCAVWFADIRGYVRLSTEDETEALGIILLFQDQARSIVERHGGAIVKFIGDGVLSSFESTEAAVRSAVELATTFRAATAARGAERRLRLGVHIGDVATSADGDVYGEGVNVASRLEQAAEAGQVVISVDVWRQLRGRAGFRFKPLGERDLKGVGPLDLFAVELEPRALTATRLERPELPHLPLVGRSDSLVDLDLALAAAADGRGGAVLLTGPGGVGKSRLARTTIETARQHGFTVAHGHSYPVDAGIPYALFADALMPLLRELDTYTRAALTRGGEAELEYLFPALASGDARPRITPAEDPAEFKVRLFWNLTQFLRRCAERQPLLIVLEDLHQADRSSLELLHFIARHVGSEPILLLCSCNEPEREPSAEVRKLEQSLIALGHTKRLAVEPLDRAETAELVYRAFGVDKAVAGEFTSLLYSWTRGNPFFVKETLQSLVEEGRLCLHEGRWLGWEVRELSVPANVRETVLARLERLDRAARSTADLLAVIGARATHALLRSLSPLADSELLSVLDELRLAHILDEHAEGRDIVYHFSHPLIREALYSEFGLARTRQLHANVAEALEAYYGDDADEHADELAYHYSRTTQQALVPKAIRYLGSAGTRALDRFANHEAAAYLTAAREFAGDATGKGGAESTDMGALTIRLARARQRLGDYRGAIELLEEQLLRAQRNADAEGQASIERRIGLAHYWSGDRESALEHYRAGLAVAEAAGADRLSGALLLARSSALQDLGRASEGLEDAQRALEIAERLDDVSLQARVHRGLITLHTWSGAPEPARRHGERAISLASASAAPTVEHGGHWALAVLEGLIGETARMRQHIDAGERLAEELRSPLLWLAITELSIEYYGAIGEWDKAIALGERAIALAGSLRQQTLLSRLLVWTALLYLGRDDMQRAGPYIDEAWDLAEAHGSAPADVHAAVVAHIGRAAFYMWHQDYGGAIRVGEAGLAIADRSGYVFWAIHRLMPIVAESYCQLRELEGASRIAKRMRLSAQPLGHRLGVAWADAMDAVVAWLSGDVARGATQLRSACDALGSIPVVLDEARLRRQLAGRLADLGDRDAALEELRRAHGTLAQLGIVRELDKTRGQFRELNARPPQRTVAEAADALTGRELQIARLVAQRKSNKAIGKALGISPRTVSTHLSNVFHKLDLDSRAALGEYVREGGLVR